MRRILLMLTAAALMAAMMAITVPAFAAVPDAGCPKNFEEQTYDFGDNSKGVPSAQVNGSDEICTKVLPAEPQNPAWEPDPGETGPTITVFSDDVVKGGGPR
jgi:hypothetical protein